MKTLHNLLNSLFIGSFMLFCSSNSLAGIAHSVGDAAPVIGEGEYSGRLLADIILNQGGGLNITPRFKTGIIDQYVDITAIVGAGKTNWQLGGVAKYNLLPDVQGQVGLSFLGALRVLNRDTTALNLGAGMIVSKKLQASFGEATPYGSLELDFVIASKNSTIPVHINFGALWEPMSTGPWAFISEVQLGIAKGLYALSVGTSYRF